ncbi:hypothetical protein [Colwellia psychrerythraea]|uniref:Uncharacterized protein n=1 Tax=Colwellia psychrerythraea TaxID=28229 RepID=A0A099KV71_COLPS|nr:hypothetical protein [Colwellia psychrerythraea]KGJ93757.1 hypothetical protein GAB14E_2312 [Colwellia psychrerythraea]
MRSWKFVLLIFVFLSVNSFADVHIAGIWKHSQKPAWFDITFESGEGSLSVKRHDNNVKAVGLNVIKSIKPNVKQSSQWLGQMYSAAEDGYVAVKLILINASTIVVFESSDVKNSNEILRITKE